MEIKGLVQAVTAKFTGGLPGPGKVFTSDAAGVGSWVTPAGGGNWTLVANLTGAFGANGPLFSGLSLSTAKAYLLTWKATTITAPGTPAYLLAKPNEGALASAYNIAYNNGVSIIVEAAVIAGPRVARTDLVDAVEIAGSMHIWIPQTLGFPHFKCDMSSYSNSVVAPIAHSCSVGRLNLGAGVDLTSMRVITDGLFNLGNGSIWSLYKAQ